MDTTHGAVSSLKEVPLGGWGNAPVEPCYVFEPARLDALRSIIVAPNTKSFIPRGLGRAYGDSALNADAGVVVQTRRNRFLSFDEITGVLECEAGLSFEEIIEHLLPRGWFLPVTPGTKYVTVGGAIAADVHGKNHHVDGTFGNFVDNMTLMLANGEVVRCSREEDPDLFWATVGGMGLTGVILTATVRLLKVESAYYNVTYKRTKNLDESLETFASTNQEFRYSVAWIDCLASGSSLGRSVLMLANDGPAASLPEKLRKRPLTPPKKGKKLVPFDMPSFALNSLSVKAFNSVYYTANRDGSRFVDYDTFYYPLDAILHWNRIYGRRGFVQYQALFPPKTAREGLVKLLEAISKSRRASFLAVLKSCGPQAPGLLSYLDEGFTLALDFPYTGEDLSKFTQELDETLLEHGGRLYLAKDALMSKETFAAMYPRLGAFQAVKNRVDPNHRFSSSQARRVGIVEDD